MTAKPARERLLIAVRTYPTPSKNYVETVCTGGITDGGEWRRLYPIPFRLLEHDQRYRTFNIVEVELARSSDTRKETRKPLSTTLKVSGEVTDWAARWRWIDPTAFDSLAALQAAEATLAPVRVGEVMDLTWESAPGEWSKKQLESYKQQMMFGDDLVPPEKIPFKFYFHWREAAGKEHKSLCISWELLQAWREYRKRYAEPLGVLREKILGDTVGPSRRISFFMGNLFQRRHIFVVCGWFAPPDRDIEKAVNEGDLFANRI